MSTKLIETYFKPIQQLFCNRMSTKKVIVTYIKGQRVAQLVAGLLAPNAENIDRCPIQCDTNTKELKDRIETWLVKEFNYGIS